MRTQLATFETVLACSRRIRQDGHDADAWHALGTALVALGYTALRLHAHEPVAQARDGTAT